MTRREYLYNQLYGTMVLILASCKLKEKEKPTPVLKDNPIKELTISRIFPEKAVAKGTIDVFWTSKNLDTISIYLKVGLTDWELIASQVDPKLMRYIIQLPSEFLEDALLSVKLMGADIEAIFVDIKTENLPLPKSLSIVGISPTEAIASEKLTVFFKAENIKIVMIELRNSKRDLLEISNIESKNEQYTFNLPSKFDLNELLSIDISGDGIFESITDIATMNKLAIQTSDYIELKLIGGFQKISMPKGEVWLTRVSSNEMKAFSSYCTHAGCGIDYIKPDNIFHCPCHGSKFTTEGKVINGPASSPLNQYNCKFVKDGVFELIY